MLPVSLSSTLYPPYFVYDMSGQQMWRGGRFLSPSNSGPPAGGPTISLSSDTIYLGDHILWLTRLPVNSKSYYESGIEKWKRRIGRIERTWDKGMECRASMSSLGVLFCQHHPVFANPEALRTPFFCVFMEASLCRHDWLNHWALAILQPPAPLLFPGWGGLKALSL